MLRHAVRTSIFRSFFSVLGKLEPLHITTEFDPSPILRTKPPLGPTVSSGPCWPVTFAIRTSFVRRGQASPLASPFTAAPFVVGALFPFGKNGAPCCRSPGGGSCTNDDGPAAWIIFDTSSFVRGQPSVDCPGGCAAKPFTGCVDSGDDGLFTDVDDAGDPDDNGEELERCDTGDMELGGLRSSAEKSTGDCAPVYPAPKRWSIESTLPLFVAVAEGGELDFQSNGVIRSAWSIGEAADSLDDGAGDCICMMGCIGGGVRSYGVGSANDMNIGLLAMVLYGLTLDWPRPKSMLIAPSVAVGSSNMLSDAGSKGISEPKLKSYCWSCCGCCAICGGEPTEDADELLLPSADERKMLPDDCDWNGLGDAALGFGTWKVNDPCFNAIFSDCNRESRSRRLSFSLSVA